MVALFLCLMLVSIAGAGSTVQWVADVDGVAPIRASVYRGETVTLSCSLVRDGLPLDLSGLEAKIYWQTNGMASAWWSAPASAGTNGLEAIFSPAMQPAGSQVLFFIGAADQEHRRTYRATGVIRLLHSPGADPCALPLPVPSIDFSRVSVTNAPWLTIETDPIFTAYAQNLNPWIEQVGQTLAGLSELPPADSILSSDNATPNRVSSDWMLLGGSSYYLPDFCLSLSNITYQTADRWEHGTQLDRDGLYLRRDRRQTDLTAGGLYTLEPGEGAATYGATSILAQGPYPRLVETRIAFPMTGRTNEVFALRSDIIGAETNAYLSVSNKTLSVISLASDPPTQIWSSEETTAIDPATNTLWTAVKSLSNRVEYVASEADPAWGKRLPSGEKNPDPNVLFLNTPATIFAAGCTWSANGTYAVLVADGSTAVATGTNSTFRIGPDSQNWFGYIEGGSVTVGARAESLRINSVKHTATIDYEYSGGDFPTLWYASSLANDFTIIDSPLWVDNGDGSATVTVPTSGPAGFWRATTTHNISSVFSATMPAQFGGGVIGDPHALPVIYDSTVEITINGVRYRIPAQKVEGQ